MQGNRLLRRYLPENNKYLDVAKEGECTYEEERTGKKRVYMSNRQNGTQLAKNAPKEMTRELRNQNLEEETSQANETSPSQTNRIDSQHGVEH